MRKNVEKQGNPQKSDHLEAPWARPGHVLVALGHSWCPLGRLLEALETPLGRSWSLLGASWTPLGRNLEKRLLRSVLGGPTWRPKSTQVGSKIQKKINVKKQHDFEVIFQRFLSCFSLIPISKQECQFCKKLHFP